MASRTEVVENRATGVNTSILETHSNTPANVTWQALLQDDFLRRKSVNPRYSMRAFAKTLGVSPSYACMVLKGQRTISLKASRDVSRRLKWPKAKENIFRLLLERETTNDPAVRAELDAQLEAKTARAQGFASIGLKEFQAMSAWYHTAMIELTRVKDFDPSPTWIARRLGITALEVELALDRLLRLGLIEKRDGSYKRSRGPVAAGGMPSSAVRRFHKDLLRRAEQAIDQQKMEDRSATSMTMAVPLGKVAEVKERIAEFRRELTALIGTSKNCDAVYHLAIQYFRLDVEPVVKGGR